MDNMSIKFALCDDSKIDRDYLSKLIYEYLDKNNIYAEIDEFQSGEELLKNDIDKYEMIFLDIYMDKINGMDIARKLNNTYVNIVFTTNSTEFAVESYDVSAFSYMVKPIIREKLFLLMDNFFYAYYSVRSITVKVGRMEADIYLSDIIYVEASGKKSIIYTKKGIVESSTSFANMLKILSQPDFVRPIRYAIVSVREIINIPTKFLLMSDGTKIQISRNERENIKKVFGEYKWKKMRDRMVIK